VVTLDESAAPPAERRPRDGDHVRSRDGFGVVGRPRRPAPSAGRWSAPR